MISLKRKFTELLKKKEPTKVASITADPKPERKMPTITVDPKPERKKITIQVKPRTEDHYIGYYDGPRPDRIYGLTDPDKPVTWHAYVNGNVTFIYVANRKIDLVPKEGKRNWRYLGQIAFLKNDTKEIKAVSLNVITKMYNKAAVLHLPNV